MNALGFRRLHLTAPVVVLVILTGPVGCGNGSDGSPGDAEIRTTIEEIWQAAEVDLDKTYISDYIRETKGNTVGCADLPNEDDRWVAYRTASLPGERYPQSQIFDNATTYLRDKGFTLKRYREPGSGYLDIRAERDEIVVFVGVSSNGKSHLDVKAGPCATFMGREPPEDTEPIP